MCVASDLLLQRYPDTQDIREAQRAVTQPLVDAHVPYILTFGNHGGRCLRQHCRATHEYLLLLMDAQCLRLHA
jgi:hypothetical protein